MSVLIQNARVLTMDDELSDYANADILVRGSKIAGHRP